MYVCTSTLPWHEHSRTAKSKGVVGKPALIHIQDVRVGTLVIYMSMRKSHIQKRLSKMSMNQQYRNKIWAQEWCTHLRLSR